MTQEVKIENNNIYLGDSYELIKKIPDKSIDLIYTDIPYLIEQGGCSDSAMSKRFKNMRDVQLKGITDGIDYSIFGEFIRITKYIYMYIWCSKEQILDIMNYFANIPNRKVRCNILVWCKTNPSPMTNGMLLPDIEYCLLFKEEGSPRFNDGYHLKSRWYITPLNKNDKDEFGHPTIKPLELVKRHIEHSTQPNDIVFDPFLGSGTTAVACKELGRQYIGFELREDYFKIAVDRLNGINQKGQTDLFNTDFEQMSLFDK